MTAGSPRGTAGGASRRPVWRALLACWRLLPERRRRQWAWVVPLSALGAVLEAVGALAVLVLVRVLAVPSTDGSGSVGAGGVTSGAGSSPASGLWNEIATRFGADSALTMALAVLTFYVAKNLALAAVTWYTTTVAQRSGAELAVRLLDAYLATPYALHTTGHSAARLQRITGAAREAAEGALSGTAALLSEVLVALGLITVVAWIAPVQTLLAAALLGALLGGVLVLARRRLHALGARHQALEHDTLRVAQDALAGFAEVRAYGLAGAVHDLFASRRHRLASLRIVLSLLETTPRLLVETVFVLGVVVVVAGREGHGQAELLGTLGVLAYAGFRLIPSINRILLHSSTVLFASAAIDLVEADLAASGSPHPSEPTPGAGEGRLELRESLRSRVWATAILGALSRSRTSTSSSRAASAWESAARPARARPRSSRWCSGSSSPRPGACS